MVSRAHRSRTHALKACAIVMFAILCVCAGARDVAYAYQEPNTMGWAPLYGCTTCHVVVPTVADNPAGGVCVDCHGAAFDGELTGPGYTYGENSGPHSGYTTTTRKCATCHSVHKSSADSVLLLPAATIVDTCKTCHDGTGGWGVYGVVQRRTGAAPGGGHGIFLEDGSFSSSNVIPGGHPETGGSLTRAFSGSDGELICTDCHSPHGADVVTAFLGERSRIRQGLPPRTSSRLLRRSPTGSASAVNDYGSDWCLGCHAGRASGGTVHNHPVESAASWETTSTRFVYDRLAVLDSALSTHETVIGRLAGTAKADGELLPHIVTFTNDTGNQGFLMPWPRTDEQGAHLPICQQCHEDSREANDLAADGSGTAAPFTTQYADGVKWNDTTKTWDPVDPGTTNPLFQNFPHETQNDYMLVEEDDDLCLNCHPMAQLP